MIDVFNEEIEVIIKDGIAHLYWYKGDLKKAWLRAGVDPMLVNSLYSMKDENNDSLTKRKLMDALYEELRKLEYNRRLEVSRNFVRVLIEATTFVPQDPRHRIEIAERCSLKLRKIINEQENQKEYKTKIKQRAEKGKNETYFSELLNLREKFVEMMNLSPQKRGYEFEKFLTELMRISNIPVEESFKIIGEQIDGAIKYDGHYYLFELKWTEEKCNQSNIASLYLKVEGKLEARGLYISMNGYSDEMLKSLPKGKVLKVLLLDGMHLSNVIYGNYTIQELLEHAISQASLKGDIYCNNNLNL